MIKADFYPTASTPTTDMELTNTLTNLNLNDKLVDPMNAYYMGSYTGHALYPIKFKIEQEGSGGSAVDVFTVEDLSKNTDCFWGYTYNSSTNDSYAKPFWNGAKWTSSGRFFNKLYAYKAICPSRTFYITGKLYEYGASVYSEDFSTRLDPTVNETSVTGNMSVNNYYDFMQRDAELTFTDTNNNTYPVKLNDWNDQLCGWVIQGENTYSVLYVTQVYLTQSYTYNANYINQGNPFSFKLGVVVSVPTGRTWDTQFGIREYKNLFYPEAPDVRLDFQSGASSKLNVVGLGSMANGMRFSTTGTLGVLNCKPFRVTSEEAKLAVKDQTSMQKHFKNNNGDVIKGASIAQEPYVSVNPFIDFKDWAKWSYGVITRLSTRTDIEGNDIGFNANTETYEPQHGVPIFNRLNIPQYLTKRNTYKELEPLLRPWQKYGYELSDDEFDPDDPGGSGGTGDDDNPENPDKEDGVDTGTPPETRIPHNFGSMSKFYALSAGDWISLSNKLQAAIQDTVNNTGDTTKFGYLLGTFKKVGAGANDVEYECADDWGINRYIASARYYPFTIDTAGFMTDAVTHISFGYRGAELDLACEKINGSVQYLPEVTIDCPFRTANQSMGSMDIADVTFEGFEPYAKYTLILPFVGELPIPAHNALCATIHVNYMVDLSSGTCCAVVRTSGGFNVGWETVGVLAGQCSTGISINGNDVVAQGDQLATATLNQKMADIEDSRTLFHAVTNLGQGTYNAVKTEGASLLNDGAGMLNSVYDIAEVGVRDKLQDIALTQAGRSVPFRMNWGSNVSGNVSTSTPVLKVERALVVRPDNFKHVFGYPTQKTLLLSKVEGYFQCSNPDVTSIGTLGPVPTEAEQRMINEALRTGSFM